MPVRWGILGCGDVARKRVAAAIQGDLDSQLVAACRRDSARLDEFCRRFGISEGFTSADEMIASTEIDALYIATPVSLHRPLTLAALRAGKHVMVEKPMALSADECQEMIAVAEQVNRRLAVAYYRRFFPVYQRIKQMIHTGELGNVLSLHICTSAPLSPEEDGYWRVDPRYSGGGPLMDVGSHRLDLLYDLFGLPTHIQCQTTQVAAAYETENVASVVCQFEGGTQATLTCLFDAARDPDSWLMVGTEAVVDATPLGGGKLTIHRRDGVSVEEHPAPYNYNSPLVADFVRAIQDGSEPITNGWSGMAVSRMMDLAYTAAESS